MSVCWLLGGLLLVSSSDSAGPIRNRARDLVAPGAELIQTAWSESSRRIAELRYRPVDSSRIDQLETELARWRRAALAMQIREARLAGRPGASPECRRSHSQCVPDEADGRSRTCAGG